MDMWDKPEYAEFKEKRDTDPTLAGYDTAKELIELANSGHPLNTVQQEYVKRFLSTNICQDFFCRLGIPFQHNSFCWHDHVPTDEQCTRCELQHRVLGLDAFKQKHRELPLHNPMALKPYRDAEGILRFRWEPTPADTSTGLVGDYAPGARIHVGTGLSKVYPVCLPSLSRGWNGGCDEQCAVCPAHGFYDSSKKVVITGLGTVVLSELKQSIADKLEHIAATTEPESDSGGEVGV